MSAVGAPGDVELAVTVTGPRTAALLTSPRPTAPLGPTQVEGPTLASLVSPGTELNWYFDPDPATSSSYPAVPGYAAVFEISRAGGDVRGLRAGDRVLAPLGRHTSWQRHQASGLVRVPDGLDPRDAVFARLMAVSMATLTTTRARPPEPVGVNGLGLVGNLAAKVFATCGYPVVAWDRNEPRRALVADAAGIAIADGPFGRRADEKAPQSPEELALVLECTGNDRAVLDACGAVRKGGEVVLVGLAWRRTGDVPASELLRVVFDRYVTLRSGWEYEVPDEPEEFRHGSARANLEAAMRWLRDGRVAVAGLATVTSPDRAGEVYARLLDRSWPSLSAIYDWTDRSLEPVMTNSGV